MQLWQVTVPYACAGIMADAEGVIQVTAPIFQWMAGKTISEIEQWVRVRRGTLQPVFEN